jgi:hypothetical protein
MIRRSYPDLALGGLAPNATSRSRRRSAVVVCDVLLLLALVWETASELKSNAFFQTAELANEAPPLDSFSSPSLALAVLNREAQRLLMAYSQKREETGLPERSGLGGATPTGMSGRAGGPRPALATSARPHPSIAPIASLHAQVEELKLELDDRLMWIYAESGLDQEFLNCYLHLAAEAPGSADVVLWLPQALKCAQGCGRTDELTDALRHLIQFHGALQRARAVSRFLEQRGLILSSQPNLTKQ